MSAEEFQATQRSADLPERSASLWTLLCRRSLRRLQLFASLKLTVTLFLLGIFLTWAGTMAQQELDMWEVISGYFRSWGVWMEIHLFFPPHWFPKFTKSLATLEETTGPLGFPFPGGYTIGLLLTINLLAAHAVRFKVNARGLRLAAGLAVILLGSLLTLAVILGGHAGGGLQGGLPFGWQWSSLWMAIKVFSIVVWIASAAGLGNAIARPGRFLGRWLYGLSVVGQGAMLFWMWYPGINSYLGDSTMRILWQLMQGGLAGVVLLVGCILAFKKRGGIVLIHAGVGLLMAGVLLGGFAVEEQMTIEEGRSASFSRDIRSVELAITDRSGDGSQDRVVVVPKSRLLESFRASQAKRDKPSAIDKLIALMSEEASPTIEHDELPFDLEVVGYYKNSTLRVRKQGDRSDVTAGEGLIRIAEEIRAGSGADSGGAVDMAAIVVQFTKPGAKKPLGTYLFSQESSSRNRSERIVVDGKSYYVQLRFKHAYKPYSMFLRDVRKDDYIGTSKVKNYSSDVRLVDAEKKVDRDIHIWMNNPLRYEGETFYQSSYHDLGGVEATTLSVVQNTGWMIPYVACMLVATGLLAHFSTVLTRYLLRRARAETSVNASVIEAQLVTTPQKPAQKEAKDSRAKTVAARKHSPPVPASQGVLLSAENRSNHPTQWIFALAVVLFFAAWLGSKAAPATRDQFAPPPLSQSTSLETPPSNDRPFDGMNIYQCGGLPTVYDGRIKPLDTLARNSLRVIANRESFIDQNEDKQPAMVWLLDVISGSEKAESQRVFRIDDPDVKSALDLQWRRGHRYSWKEINHREGELRKQVQLAREIDADKMSNFQRKVLELNGKVQMFFALRNSHMLPSDDDDPARQAEELYGLVSASQQLSGAQVPYSVPISPKEQSWGPLTIAATVNLLKEWAQAKDSLTVETLSGEIISEMFSEDRIQEAVDSRLLSMVESITASKHPEYNVQEVRDYSRTMLEQMPPEVRANASAGSRREVLGELAALQGTLIQSMNAILGDEKLTDPANADAVSMKNLLTAYRKGDTERFNSEVDQYRKRLATQNPKDLKTTKVRFEAMFNRIGPFTFCIISYVFAFLLTALGWAFWRRPLNRAALWLIMLAFAVHTFALVARMIIAERPMVLVTNLYSSAIVIGWAVVFAGIVLEWVFKLGIGNVMATVVGFATLLIANFLSGEGDTLSVMQAVLDTNIWLATHVTCVTFGYAATFAAGFLGIAYIGLGMATPALSKDLSKELARITYGIVCFAIFFSFVGTVLGGLWADDSWGRFWGWDPKENGALMIVLWNCVVLHARWGRMIKDRGLAVLVVGGNIVTAWSWFGVNELGVGLHSYGFTEGVLRALLWWIGSQMVIIVVGCLPVSLWWSFRQRQEQPVVAKVVKRKSARRR